MLGSGCAEGCEDYGRLGSWRSRSDRGGFLLRAIRFAHSERFPTGMLIIFLLLKFLSRIWGATMSSLRPLQPLECAIGVWPPVKPLGVWLERVWFAPFERWDVTSYMRIASAGYRPDDGSTQFHPLYGLLARPLVGVGLSPLVALSMVSCAAAAMFIVAFYRLARRDLGGSEAQFATICLMASPISLALFVPYAEPLFLLLAALSIYWADIGRWWLSGISAGLATLTRQQGLLLLFPLTWMAYTVFRGRLQQFWSGEEDLHLRWGVLFSLSAAPLTYLGWSIYRALYLDGSSPDLRDVNAFIYSVLISPKAFQVVPEQAFVLPWIGVARAVGKLLSSPDVDIVVNIIGASYFLTLVILVWPHLRAEYKVFTAFTTLISFSYYTGPVHPYMGLLRHLLLGFPVFLGMPKVVRGRLGRTLLIAVSAFGFFMTLFFFCLEIWVL